MRTREPNERPPGLGGLPRLARSKALPRCYCCWAALLSPPVPGPEVSFGFGRSPNNVCRRVFMTWDRESLRGPDRRIFEEALSAARCRCPAARPARGVKTGAGGGRRRKRRREAANVRGCGFALFVAPARSKSCGRHDAPMGAKLCVFSEDAHSSLLP